MGDICRAKTATGDPCTNGATKNGACRIAAHQVQVSGNGSRPAKTEGGNGRGKNSKAHQVMERQRVVLQMRMSGATNAEIAEELNVSVSTVERYSKEVRDRLRAGLEAASKDPVDIIVDELAHFAAIRHTALRDYESSRTFEVVKDVDGEEYEVLKVTNAKAGLLNVAISATEKRIRILQQTGYLRHDIGVLRVVDEKERALADMSEPELQDYVSRNQADLDRLLGIMAEANGKH